MSEETTCCFTGHRPHRLPWHEDEWDPRCQHLREELDRQVDRAYDRGYRHFISGMAQGGDLMFCESVLRLKERHPEVVLEAAVPYPGAYVTASSFRCAASIPLSSTPIPPATWWWAA